MEDELTLDRIDTQSEFNLVDICNDDKENSDSPCTTISNSCNYYEPVEVQGLTNSNGLSLFSLNCQGLKSHWDEFRNLIENTSEGDGLFDILGITELYSMFTGECNLKGYHSL